MHVQLELLAEPEHVWLHWAGLATFVLAYVFTRMQVHMQAVPRQLE